MFKTSATYIAIIFLYYLAFPSKGFSQLDKSTFSSYKITADSILKVYYGEEMVKYINIDSNRSQYRTLKTGGGESLTKFTAPLAFDPEMFVFHYDFKHPGFKGDTLEIRFYIDKRHQLMAGFLPTGLFDIRTAKIFTIITKESALAISKKHGLKKPQSNYEIELGWDEQKPNYENYKTTKDLRDIVKGRIVWKIKCKYRDPLDGDENPYAETFIIDAITGALLGIEHDTIDWG